MRKKSTSITILLRRIPDRTFLLYLATNGLSCGLGKNHLVKFYGLGYVGGQTGLLKYSLLTFHIYELLYKQ